MMFLAHATQFATLLAAAAEEEQFDANKVSPGVGGFLVIALLGVAVFFLGLDLVRRLRRIKYRAEIHEELAAEIAERDAVASAAAAGSVVESGRSEGAVKAGEADPRPVENE